LMSSAETENQPPHATPGKSVLESSFEGRRAWAHPVSGRNLAFDFVSRAAH
jgi:hypothetical protein